MLFALDMRATDNLPLPNPLASHAPARSEVNSMAPEALPPLHHHSHHGAPSSRPSTSAANATAAREHMEESSALVSPSSNGTAPARPSLSRARSDFGPRHPAPPPESADDGSTDGHFKIRHGWDDQLNSEEYSNLLTSVCATLALSKRAHG